MWCSRDRTDTWSTSAAERTSHRCHDLQHVSVSFSGKYERAKRNLTASREEGTILRELKALDADRTFSGQHGEEELRGGRSGQASQAAIGYVHVVIQHSRENWPQGAH